MENKTMLSMDQLNSVTGGAGSGTPPAVYYVYADNTQVSGPFNTQEEATADLMENGSKYKKMYNACCASVVVVYQN